MSQHVVPDELLKRAQRESGWTDTRTAVMLQLWNAAVPASQIACLMGGITRNAVIGKVTTERERLTRGGTTASDIRTGSGVLDPTKPKAVRSAASPCQLAPTRLSKPKTATQKAAARGKAPPIVDREIPDAQRKQLIDLDATCCHWPVGDPRDPDFFFCGSADVIEGEPYCKAHMRRAHDTTGQSAARRTPAPGGAHGWR